jgi:hypothetical protein
MATIGSITVAFGADPGGLKKGVDDSIGYLSDLRASIAETSSELSKFNATLSAQAKVANAALGKMQVEKQIRIDADFAAVEDAAREVDVIAESIESNSSPKLTVSADTSALGEASVFVREFAATASDCPSADAP